MLLPVLRQLSAETFRSGEAIARALGVSRASVHNAVARAQGLGIAVHAVRGRGYRLVHAHSWLDAGRLGAAVEPLGYRFQLVDEVDSTNRALMAKAQAGAAHKTVLAAELQAAGRGRRGRSWLAPLGGALSFSVLWHFQCGAADLSGLSLAVGLGVARGLEALGVGAVRLKWPNDILLEGRKLAGILIELQGEMQGPSLAVIGIGLNVRLPEAMRRTIDQPVADLVDATGRMPDRNDVLASLLVYLDQTLVQFETAGFAALREAWNARHAFHGQPASILAGQGEAWHGRVAGVDASGALLLDTGQGLRRFYTGEVSLRRSKA